jgi:putative transposase
MSVLNLLRKKAPGYVNVKALHKLFDALIINANPFQIQFAPNCRYTPNDIMQLLAYASLERQTIESTCTLLSVKEGVPCASAVRNALVHHPPAHIDTLVNDYLLTTLKKLKRFASSAQRKPSTVIVDFHDDPYYGKDEAPYVLSGKPTKSTKRVFRYATACLIEHGVSYTLAMHSVNKTATRFEIVNYLIERAKKLVKVKVVLADAAFYSVEVVRFLDQEGITFIIRGVKNKGVKSIINRVERELVNDGACKSVNYPMKSHGNKEWYPVKLLLYRQQPEVRVLVVNQGCPLKAHECIRLYKRRFGIETAYRMKHGVKAWTTSKKAVLRSVLFGMSCVLYTFWAIYRNVVAKTTQRHNGGTKAIKQRYEGRMWLLLSFLRLTLAPRLSQEGSLP